MLRIYVWYGIRMDQVEAETPMRKLLLSSELRSWTKVSVAKTGKSERNLETFRREN